MTVKEIIDKVGTLRRNNQFSIEDKMEWLNQCEAKIQLKCLLMPCVEIQYDYDADADEELIAKTPFDEIYVYYICAKIDEALGEMERYNDTIAQYNDAQGDYQKWLIKTYDPKHNEIRLERDVPVIAAGDEVEIELYGIPVSAGEVTTAKAFITQGEQTTEITDVSFDGNVMRVLLAAEQTHKLSKGSLFVGYSVTIGEEKYENERAERLYVEVSSAVIVSVRGEEK